MKTIQVKQPRAFTLIELLVAIGIIGVLAALLLSVLQQGKKAAGSVQCVSNLRQIISAWELFGTDHNQRSLAIGANLSIPDPKGVYVGWASQLRPYLGNKSDDLLMCPAANQANTTNHYGSTLQPWYSTSWNNSRSFVCSYSFSGWWYSDFSSFDTWPPDAVYYPVYIYNNTYPVFADGTWIDGGRAALPVNFTTGSSWSMVRHGGKGVNMAFPDGSVRLITMGQLYSTIILHPGDVINPSWIQQIPAAYQ